MSKDNINDKDELQLSADQPTVPIIEDEEPTAPGWSKKDIKHNIFVMVMLIVIFELGWEDFQIALMPYLVDLGMSNTSIGFIRAATIFTLPGLFLSPFISRKLKQKKLYAWGANMLYILMIGLLGLSVVFSEHLGLSKASLITVTFILLISHHFIAGFVSLPVQEFISGCIPASFRGRYNGLSHTTGAVAGLATTGLSAWILLTQPKPTAFGYLFLIAWVIGSLGWSAALFAREKPTDSKKVPVAWSKEMLLSVWHNVPFVRLTIVSFLCGALLSGGTSYIQLYGYNELKMGYYNAAIFTTIGLVSRLATAVPIGFVVDKYGPKRFMPYWGILQALGLAFPIILQNEWGVYLSIVSNVAFFGFFATARSIVGACIPKPEHRAGTYTVAMIVGHLGSSADKIIGGMLCDAVGYRMAFIIFAIGCILSTPAWIWVTNSLRDDRKDLY